MNFRITNTNHPEGFREAKTTKPKREERSGFANPPMLALNEEENTRILVAGRKVEQLKEARIFDHTRIEESPLFAPTMKKLF